MNILNELTINQSDYVYMALDYKLRNVMYANIHIFMISKLRKKIEEACVLTDITPKIRSFIYRYEFN